MMPEPISSGIVSTVPAERIGSIAQGLLHEGGRASVLGRTSRGLFLHLQSNRVVFLSQEAFCGPLTINISADLSQIQDASRADGARLIPEGIFFPDPGVLIDTRQASPWSAAPRPARPLRSELRRAMLDAVIRLGVSWQNPAGTDSLLQSLVQWESTPKTPVDSQAISLRTLGDALAGGRPSSIVNALDHFLGRGTGLTPSGDDLVLGLLLALNRWAGVLAPEIDRPSINQAILPRLAQKTTALSANLIECAILGQADQRLIAALDGLVTGGPDAEACAASLGSWGSSSGFDALVGMALVLRTG
jgi:hypothetical protein